MPLLTFDLLLGFCGSLVCALCLPSPHGRLRPERGFVRSIRCGCWGTGRVRDYLPARLAVRERRSHKEGQSTEPGTERGVAATVCGPAREIRAWARSARRNRGVKRWTRDGGRGGTSNQPR